MRGAAGVGSRRWTRSTRERHDRERVLVALSGESEGETLIRRAARVAERAGGGELLAVHVSSQDAARSASPGDLAAQQALVESLGGTYHQVIGEDIPRAIVDFARSRHATQLVIGESRRGRLSAVLSGPGVGTTVIRESGEIDVHMVTHAAAGYRFALPRVTGGALSRQRVAAGVRRRAGRRTAPHLAALLGPHTRVDHVGGAGVPAARRRRGARRRHLARALRRGALGPDPRLPLRRPAVHRRGLGSAAPLGALPLRRDRAAGQLHRRQGGAAGAHRPARRRRGRAARDRRRQRAARRERRARARDPGARGVRACPGCGSSTPTAP